MMGKSHDSSKLFCYRCKLVHSINSPCIGTPCWFCNEIVLNNPIGLCNLCIQERCPQLNFLPPKNYNLPPPNPELHFSDIAGHNT